MAVSWFAVTNQQDSILPRLEPISRLAEYQIKIVTAKMLGAYISPWNRDDPFLPCIKHSRSPNTKT
jgi:hypothetical protein